MLWIIMMINRIWIGQLLNRKKIYCLEWSGCRLWLGPQNDKHENENEGVLDAIGN